MPDPRSIFPDPPAATALEPAVPGTAAPAVRGPSLFPPAPDPLRDAMGQRTAVAPDQAARVFAMQRKTGLPAEVIQRNLASVEKSAAASDFDPVAFRKATPLLASWLEAHPLHTALAGDDLVPLSAMEHTLMFGKNAARATLGGLIGGVNLGFFSILEASGDVSDLVGLGSGLSKLAKDQNAWAQTYAKQVTGEQAGAGYYEKVAYSGFQSIGSSLPILAATVITKNPTLALTMMGTQTGGQAYSDARAAGVPVPQALAYGTAQGMVEAWTESLGTGWLIKDLKEGAPLFKVLAHQMVSEGFTEEVATTLQNLNDWAILHPDQPFSSYVQALPQAWLDTELAVGVTVAGQGSAAHALNRVVTGLATRRMTHDLVESVQASTLLKTDPAKLQEFLEHATKDTPAEFRYASPQTWVDFWRGNGEDPQAKAEALGISPDAYRDALDTGADLRIPTAAYAVQMADHAPFWENELREAPGEFNARETHAFLAAEAATPTVTAPQPLTRTPAEQIQADLSAHLQAVGAMPAGEADTNAALLAGFFATIERVGLDPQQILDARLDAIRTQEAPGSPVSPAPGPELAQHGVLTPEEQAALLATPQRVRALDRRQTQTEMPLTGERRGLVLPADLLPVGEEVNPDAPINAMANIGAAAARMLREDPTLRQRAAAMQAQAQATPRQTEASPYTGTPTFWGYEPDPAGAPLAKYTVQTETGPTQIPASELQRYGLPVPETPAPPPEGDRPNGDEMRRRAFAARGLPMTLFQSLTERSAVDAPMFFSRIVRAVEESTLAKAPGAQWTATIKNAKSGISQDEAALLNVERLEPATVYTKQQVLDYLAVNALKVEIVELSGESVDEDALSRELDRRREQAINSEVESLQENYDKDEAIEEIRQQFDPPPTETELVEADPDDEDSSDHYLAYVDGEVITEYDRRTRTYAPRQFDTEDDADDAVREALDQLESDYVDENYSEPDFYDQARDYVNDTFDESEERQNIIENGDYGATDGVQYEEYSVDGPKDDYREIFVTVPDVPAAALPKPTLLDEHATISLGRLITGVDREGTEREFEILANGEPVRHENPAPGQAVTMSVWAGRALSRTGALDHAVTLYHAERERRQNKADRRTAVAWQDGHGAYENIENPVVRLRLDTRETSLGNTLFIEEAQPPHGDEPGHVNQQAKMPPLLIKNWRELAMKYALRHAAENGHAAVAWATGLQTAVHYSLNRVVKTLNWGPVNVNVPSTTTVTPPEMVIVQRDDPEMGVQGAWAIETNGEIRGHYATRADAMQVRDRDLAAWEQRHPSPLDLLVVPVTRDDGPPRYALATILPTGGLGPIVEEFASRAEAEAAFNERAGVPVKPTEAHYLDIVTKDHGTIRLIVGLDGLVKEATEKRLIGVPLSAVIGKPAVDAIKEAPGGGEVDAANLPISISPGLSKIYDEDLRNVTNKLAVVKKAKARVTTATMQVKGTTQKAVIGSNPALRIEPVPRTVPGEPPLLWTLVLQDGTRWGAWESEVYAQQGLDQWNGSLAPIDPSYQSTQQAIEITPALKAAILGGQPLFQTVPLGQPQRRAGITFDPQTGKASIALYALHDRTSFIHEFGGHLHLEMLGDVVAHLDTLDPATLTDAQRRLTDDYRRILLPWLGPAEGPAVPGGRFTPAQHEKFADGVEDYLMTNRAPSLALQPVFARVKAWMLDVYRLVKRQVQLTPEVRGFMDRLLAADDAIAAVEAQGTVTPLFLTAEEAGKTPEEWALYRKTVEAAHIQAEERLGKKMAADQAREMSALWKDQRQAIHDAVEQELQAEPVYRALAAIRQGTHPNGEPLVAGQVVAPLKMNRAEVVAAIGENATKTLPKPYVYTNTGGVSPGLVAEMFGFDSPAALLTAIGTTPKLETVLEARTDQQMIAKHGGILVDGTLPAEAQEALANEGRDQVIRAEIRALQKLGRTVGPHVRLAEKPLKAQVRALTGQVAGMQRTAAQGPGTIARAVPSQVAIATAAQARVARTPVRDLHPQNFWHAAQKANREAIAAAARQDFDVAITAHTQQLIALAAYRASTKALAEVQTRVEAARALDSVASRRRIGKAGQTYQDQIDGVLDRYEFATVSNVAIERRAGLREWAAAMVGQGYPVELTAAQLDDSRRVNYRELTVAELAEVTDGLQQIVHLAQLKNKLLKSADVRTFGEQRDGIVDSITTHNEQHPQPLEFRQAELAKRTVADWIASHRKIAFIINALDGYVDGGPFWQAFVRPMNEAANAETDRKTLEGQKYWDIVNAAYPGRALHELGKQVAIPALGGQTLSREGRIAVGLNYGNPNGRERLLNDPTRKWTQTQVTAILDTLDRHDWDFIKATWAFNERFWAEIEALERKVTGIAPAKVAYLPFETKFGTMPGGYYHLAYDPRLSPGAEQHEAANLLKFGAQASYVRAATRQGFVEEQKASVGLSLRLELGVEFSHIEEVIHSLTHRELVSDLSRLLRDPKIRGAIIGTKGDLIYKQLTLGVQDIALGTLPAARTILEKAASFARSGTQISQLAFNVWTAAQQPLGWFNGMAEIGPTWVAKGLVRWLRSADDMEGTIAWAAANSSLMRNRWQTQSQDFSDLRAVLRKPGGWFDTLVRTVSADHLTQQTILDSYLWHIGMMQRVADMPVFLGALAKFSEQHPDDEPKAIALAEQAILNSQGGGQIKDLAQVQRGSPIARLYMAFYSYGNMTLNQAGKAVGQTRSFKSPAEVARLLGNLSLIYVAPAMATVMLAHVFGRGKDDDDWTDYLRQVGGETLASAMNGIVALRELAGLVGEGNRGYAGPAGARLIEVAYGFGQQVKQFEPDEAFFKSLNQVAGMFLGYPAAQAQKTVDGYLALQSGRSQNPMVLLTGPPPKVKK